MKQFKVALNSMLGFMLVGIFAVMLGCASTAKKEGTGEYIDDSVITTKVKAAVLNEPTLKSAEINVETFKGVVQLSGFVNSEADIAKAALLARGVKGVTSVKNDMRLKAKIGFAEICTTQAALLKGSIETNGWDGEWYRRAYFDDGTPLGSNQNDECQIDSISQSWAVISKCGDPARARQAMESVYNRLVQFDAQIIKLLDPPFDQSNLDPGYIKGYVPGVRENGGQYTHAAIWAAMAFAIQGENERVWALFNMLNPINHTSTPAQVSVYKVEPYVTSADIYAAAPHTGRGGWTWYTGAAGWMYRLTLETLLGITLEGDQLRIKPCVPENWQSYKIHYRYRDTVYHITIDCDSKQISSAEKIIQLENNGVEHFVQV